MKAISTDMILTSASTRADGSLGIRLSTPELTPAEKTAFFELLNKNLRCVIQPIDNPADELVEVRAPLGFRSPSQQLRAVLYRLWEQEKPVDEVFNDFYVRKMNHLIEKVKALLA